MNARAPEVAQQNARQSSNPNLKQRNKSEVSHLKASLRLGLYSNSCRSL